MRDRQEDGSVWHEGEIAVQKRAGLLLEAKGLQDSIHSTIPDAFRTFIAAQRFAVLGSVDARARLWASPITGEPGFMHCPDRFSLRIQNSPVEPDLAARNLAANRDAGLLIIGFAHRRRIRLNGEAAVLAEGGILIQAKQIYSNCPRYIQARVFEPQQPRSRDAVIEVHEGSHLSAKQQDWIRSADTCFMATADPDYGVDVSHKGGNPGFVHVESANRLMFPDYNGNAMFNSLGNIFVNPRAGLLFMDFESGNSLQVTGKATIGWDKEQAVQFAGAERVIDVEIESIIEQSGIELARYRFQNYSPHNPA